MTDQVPSGNVAPFTGLQLPQLTLPALRKYNFSRIAGLLNSLPQPGGASQISDGSIARQILQGTNWTAPIVDSGKADTHDYSLWNRVTDLLSAPSDFLVSGIGGALKAHTDVKDDNPVADFMRMVGGGLHGTLQAVGRATQPILTDNPLVPDAIEPRRTQRNDWVKFMYEQGPNADILQNPDQATLDYLGGVEGYQQLAEAEQLKGTIMDIVLDPLNLVSGGAGDAGIVAKVKAMKKARDAANALKVTEDANSLEALKNITKEQFGVKPPEVNTGPVPVQPNASNLDLSGVPKLTVPPGANPMSATRIAGVLQDLPKYQTMPPITSQLGGVSEGLSNALKALEPTGVPPMPTRPPMVPSEAVSGASKVAKVAGTLPPEAANTDEFLAMLQNSKNEVAAESRLNVARRLDNPELRAQMSTNAIEEAMASTPGRWRNVIQKSLKAQLGKNVNYKHLTKYLSQFEGKSEAIFKDLQTRPAAKAALIRGLDKVLEFTHRDSPLGTIINGSRKAIEEGTFAGMRDEAAVRRAIAEGSLVKWSGPKQVNTWNAIVKRIPYSGPKKYEHALELLRDAEQYFIDKGHIPYSSYKSAHSVPLRLSNVISKIGASEFAKHEELATTLLRSALAGPEDVVQGVEKARQAAPKLAMAIDAAVADEKAASAVAQAPAVKEGAKAGDEIASAAINSPISDARKTEDVTIASKVAEDIARNAGAGEGGANLASSIVKKMYLSQNKVQSAITAAHVNTFNILSSGNYTAKSSSASRVSNAIQATIGGPSVTRLGTRIGPDANAVEWLGSRFAATYNLFGTGSSKLANLLGTAFNPAYANAEMRPIFLQEAATARASVAARVKAWNATVKQFGNDPELWSKAVQEAQGGIPNVPGSPENQLADIWRTQMENLFGSSGLRKGAALDNTVVGRGQLMLEDLNRNLQRYGLPFKFSRSEKVIDALGREHNFSQGTDWLNSWESWAIKDPQKTMLRLTNAVENSVREAKMFEEIGERFGSVGKRSGKTVPVGHKRLSGYYFSTEHSNQIHQFIKNLEDVKKPNSKLMQTFDKAMSKFKAAVTIYMPSHHIRNAIGDIYMNWLAGVNDTRVYSDAIKVMRSQRNRYTEMTQVGDLTSPEAIKNAIRRGNAALEVDKPVRGDQILFTMKNGQHVTNDMLYTSAFQQGILPAAHVLEDIPEEDAILRKTALSSPFGGRVRQAADTASEYREHFIRLAHYTDSMKKSSKPFQAAMQDAAADVRKWHPDGMDLTTFERTVMRRVFPFYSWSRKAYPLILESIVARPNKILLYPKLMYYGPALAGQNVGPNLGDPFPEDQLFPNWMRASGIGPVAGGPGNYLLVNPSNPALDVVRDIGDPRTAIGSNLNPAARIPIELLMGRTLNDAPITNTSNYAINQIPGISTVGRLTNITSPTEEIGPNYEKIANFLTGMGIRDTGPFQREGYYDVRDYLKAKAKEQRGG